MSRFSSSHYCGRPLLTLALGALLAGCGGGGGGSDSDVGLGGSADIQGTISIASGSRVDSDYADPGGTSSGGELSLPATVGGYLSSTSGAYSNGNSYPADASDTYSVNLQDGDSYLLQCFPSVSGVKVDDLDVSLELTGGTTITDTACGSGGTVGSSPVTQVQVSTTSGGPFRYVLTLTPQGSLSSMNVPWPEPELRVNEAVMSGPAAMASTMSSSGLRASSVIESMRSIGPGLWHLKRDGGVSSLAFASSTAGTDPRAETIEWIETMREEFGLDVEPNYLFRTSAPPDSSNDGYFNNVTVRGPDNWNLTHINADTAWARAGDPSGSGVGVAVLDTGLVSTNLSGYGFWHDDLASNVIGDSRLLDFVSSAYDVDANAGRDIDPATPLTPGNEVNTSFHGTHVAGIIAAADNTVGTIGVAYESTILPYRVLGVDPVTGEDGVGSVADLIDAIADAAGRPDDVDVINLSLGGLPPLDAVQTVIDQAYSNQILVVAAAGNNGDASAVYPAANRRVVGVGTTNRNRNLASYSNYGVSVDLVAPGGDVGDGIVNAYGDVDGSNNISSGYAYLAGTSMAAPHVSGVFALMKGLDPTGFTADKFRAQLIAGNLTNTDAGNLNNYDFALHGEGLLDADKALAAVGSFPTVVSAWPRVQEISSTGSESEVLLEVLKDESASVPEVTGAGVSHPSQFTVTDGDGNSIEVGDPLTGSVKIRVDAAQVPSDRPLSGNVVIPYTNESASPRDLVIPIYVQAQDPVSQRDAGRHYVLLLDVTDFDSAKSRQVVARYGNGRYQYAFDDVAPGDYILVAGTDLDNNGFICENGEACAEYPRTGFRGVITVRSGEAQRLDMTTSFRRPNIAEMGLPRYGFEGYSIPGLADDNQAASKQLK